MKQIKIGYICWFPGCVKETRVLCGECGRPICIDHHSHVDDKIVCCKL